MKAKPYKRTSTGWTPCKPDEADTIFLHFPGPIPNRMLSVNKPKGSGPVWAWNNDVDKPTVSPSIKTVTTKPLAGSDKDEEIVCHSFVTNGIVHFCEDSTHEFAGKSEPLLDVHIH